ncbi:uncharacterized protein LOC117305111 isoform X2 [Asterias rubens]|nr:uncharacterized protein LOC117305111 isoform X2 [Asterias rubens]
MKATCVLCALVFVLVLDLFSQSCADEAVEEPSRSNSAWLPGNRIFHDFGHFQRPSRWGGRLRTASRPHGRAPRAYDDLTEEGQVFRRWGSRRMPYKGDSDNTGHKRDWEDVPESGIEGEFKRDDAADEEARLEDVIQYLR